MSRSHIPEAVLDADTPPPADLARPASRARLTPAAIESVVRLAEIWQLTNRDICRLLGDVSERSWFRMKKGGAASVLNFIDRWITSLTPE